MPPSKLLKTVFNKSLQGVESKGLATHVYVWTQTYCRMHQLYDQEVMQQFLQILREVHVKRFRDVGVYAEDVADVRVMLSGIIPGLLDSLKRELPAIHVRFVAIDWRALFEIETKSDVTLESTKPNDSGGSGLSN